jgi:hypothetical protein
MSVKKYKNKVFHFNQYWNVHYTEVYGDKTEKDYKVIIKARSLNYAKEILLSKVKEDNPTHKVKALQIYMFRKGTAINHLRLNLTDWDKIKKASFPNAINTLFKFHTERPKHYTNRFNDSKSPKGIGFVKGHTRNYHYIPPEEEKPYWIFDGKWRPWPKKERENLKEKIRLALVANGNSRRKAAKDLGVCYRTFFTLLKEKFVEVDWTKEYPPEKPNPHLHPEKRRKSLKRFYAEAKEKKRKLLSPKIHELISQGYSRNKITKILKVAKPFIKYCIEYER